MQMDAMNTKERITVVQHVHTMAPVNPNHIKSLAGQSARAGSVADTLSGHVSVSLLNVETTWMVIRYISPKYTQMPLLCPKSGIYLCIINGFLLTFNDLMVRGF